MKIAEGLLILKAEMLLGRAPVWKNKARPLSKYAQEITEAALSDQKNHDNNLFQCLGCGFIVSSLLTSEGCPNCGVEELTENIKGEKDEQNDERTR